MSKNQSIDIHIFRRQARALFRDLRSTDNARVVTAARRFQRLRSFVDLSPDQLLENIERVRLKHALAVIAKESGHESWNALLDSHSDAHSGLNQHIEASRDAMYVPGISALINRWFGSYDEARDSLRDMGGCLLPYGKQFYVTERAALELLGFDAADADWEKIGWDWWAPADADAWSRLWQRRQRVISANDEDAS